MLNISMDFLFIKMVEIGIYLSLIFPLFFMWMLLTKNSLNKIVSAIFCIINITYLLWSMNRVGLLCITTGTILAFTCYSSLEKKHVRDLKFFIVFLTVSILTYLFFLKNDSTSGRLFIYRTGLKTMIAHFPLGVGYGNYSSAFNHQQATYFSNHSISNKTAMLANDGYYALNEYLHTGIEFGIVGLVIMVLLSVIIFKKCYHLYKTHCCSAFQFGSILFFSSLFIQCVYSYPLHYPFVILTTVFAFNILFDYPAHKFWLNHICHNQYINYSLFTALAVFAIVLLYQSAKANTIYKSALEDLQLGYKNEAVKKFTTISKIYTKRYGFVDTYANTLYLSGKTSEAIAVMEKAHDYACSRQFHAALGNWYAEMGDSIKAKQNLETALYIAPQYLQSRLDLMNFYVSRKDSANAKLWAEKIIDCPIKIPSSKANSIKSIAVNYLKANF